VPGSIIGVSNISVVEETKKLIAKGSKAPILQIICDGTKEDPYTVTTLPDEVGTTEGYIEKMEGTII
jgi:hypothetical protein